MLTKPIIRIRFHGRGGQGVKVASRIIGTAGFKAGLHAQDSPLYGAERRGAPVAAFTRLGTRPIQERGIIDHPDLVVLFDETLLDNPQVDPAAGMGKAAVMAVNTKRDPEEIRKKLGLAGPIVCQNVTAISLNILGRNLLSGSFTGVVAKILGFEWRLLEEAIAEELSSIHLEASSLEKNIEAALCCYKATPDIPMPAEDEPEELNEEMAHEIEFLPANLSSPTVLNPGNAAERKTGAWRQVRPVVAVDQCRPCFTCYLRCPEAAIALDEKNYPVILYDYCKGCMVCYEVCPTHAIGQEVEAHAQI